MSVVIVEPGYLDDAPYLDVFPYLTTGAYGYIKSQFEVSIVASIKVQFESVIYNVGNLRILCDFDSRGASTIGGLNAWGNTIGEGENWVASSTATGDFSVFNLNTDIVEQVWRSATGVVTGVTLDCDTEVVQGRQVDTIALLNHNLTTAATIDVVASNSATFSPVGKTFTLTQHPDNMYRIEEELPEAFRYWRFIINDPGQAAFDNYLELGNILFGGSEIFHEECFVQNVSFKIQDFTDTVFTEGFTNVSNARSQKRLLGLEFQSLQLIQRQNFAALRNVFRTQRTSLKCLWIPTPNASDQEITDRFAVFGKLTDIPMETHNAVDDETGIYVSLSVEIDEAK